MIQMHKTFKQYFYKIPQIKYYIQGQPKHKMFSHDNQFSNY